MHIVVMTIVKSIPKGCKPISGVLYYVLVIIECVAFSMFMTSTNTLFAYRSGDKSVRSMTGKPDTTAWMVRERVSMRIPYVSM